LHAYSSSAQLKKRLQPHQQTFILCDIVGRMAEVPAKFFYHGFGLIIDDSAASRSSRISSRRTVNH